nr:ubiquitin carboxyl-terminal hydrolase MINDY-1 [Zonotrichia albicollis]
MAHLGNCILATQPKDTSEGLQLNFQQNISDTMTVLPKLSTGLDVNVRFTGVSDFEYTPECIVFDLLNIPLYHGWLVDPQVSPPAWLLVLLGGHSGVPRAGEELGLLLAKVTELRMDVPTLGVLRARLDGAWRNLVLQEMSITVV